MSQVAYSKRSYTGTGGQRVQQPYSLPSDATSVRTHSTVVQLLGHIAKVCTQVTHPAFGSTQTSHPTAAPP